MVHKDQQKEDTSLMLLDAAKVLMNVVTEFDQAEICTLTWLGELAGG